MNMIALLEKIITMLAETVVATSADGTDKMSTLCDAGTDTHITPPLNDLTATHTGDYLCTIGNKC